MAERREPTVVDTGHTVSLIHRIYAVTYPDGATEEIIPAQCARDAGDELAWVRRRAGAKWRRRQRERGE